MTSEAPKPRRSGQVIPIGKNKFRVRVFLGRNQKGHRQYKNYTVHGNTKDANTFLTKRLRERDLGLLIEPSKQTLNSYLDYWLKAIARPRVELPTLNGYAESLDLYIRPTLGEMRLIDLRYFHIQTLYGDMIEKGYRAITVRHAHTPFASALKQALREGVIVQDPCSLVELPQLEHREMEVLDAEQCVRFLNHARGNRFALMFTIALFTGMRPEEYFALQWSDVDWTTRDVSLRRALKWLSTKKGDWYFGKLKTERSRRCLRLPLSLIRLLQEHRRVQAEQMLKKGAAYQKNDLIFATRTGEPLQAWSVTRKYFKPILTAAELPMIRLYDLRHTFATLALKARIHPKVVSEWMGHSSVRVTMDTYSHVLPPMMAELSDTLESMLFSQVGTLLAHADEGKALELPANLLSVSGLEG